MRGLPELLCLGARRPEGQKIGPPRFWSRKDSRQSIRFTRNARFYVRPDGTLRLPKIGNVKVHWSREEVQRMTRHRLNPRQIHAWEYVNGLSHRLSLVAGPRRDGAAGARQRAAL